MCTKNTALGDCFEINTAHGFVSCCISLNTPPHAVFSIQTRGSALSNIYDSAIKLYTVPWCPLSFTSSSSNHSLSLTLNQGYDTF